MFSGGDGVAGDEDGLSWLGKQNAAGSGGDAGEGEDVDALRDGIGCWIDAFEYLKPCLDWFNAAVFGVFAGNLKLFLQCDGRGFDLVFEGQPHGAGEGGEAANGVVLERGQEDVRDVGRLRRASLAHSGGENLWGQPRVDDDLDAVAFHERGRGVAGTGITRLIPEGVLSEGADGDDAGGGNHSRNRTGTRRGYAVWMNMIRFAAVGVLAVPGGVGAQVQPAAGELPWFLQLGESSMQLRARVPVARQVVLVPDAQTLSDEVSKWTPQAQWPVLIEDDVLAPMFIRRFKPKLVLRRSSVGGWSDEGAATQMVAAAAAAWGGTGSPRAAATAAGLPPPSGLIISDPSDSAAVAAVLLSAGRGQDIAWIDGSFGTPNGVLSAEKTAAFVQQVEAAATATNLSWQTLGDQIDTLTICRAMSARGHTAAPVPIPKDQGGPVAMTDVLGRTASGQRWAVAGWIFGSAARSAYMANCSLFLPRINVWMCDTYPDSPPWTNWSMTSAAADLQKAGYQVTLLEHVTVASLNAADMEGLKSDLVLMNSKGNADFFQMAGGGDADPGDVPILDQPAALSMIHSWSLRSPDDSATVGGRWLLHGVYAYVGSSEEPQLQAFVPPELVAKRIAGGVPLLVAARWWPASDRPMERTWRINTIGDPLMIVPPPKGTIRRPAPPQQRADLADLVNVKQKAVQRMQTAQTSPSDENFAAAISDVALLGLDKMAAELWTAASQKGVNGPLTARAAFGSLYRMGDHDAVVAAWGRLVAPSLLEGDMLWAMFGPSLSQGTSDEVLSVLGQAIVPGGVVGRTSRLVPVLASRYGSGAAMATIDRAIGIATNVRQRRALEALR